MMNEFSLTTLLVAQLLAGHSALASQDQINPTLGNYSATVLESEAKANQLYQDLPTKIFTKRSGCYQRAHYWSYNLYEDHGIKSMKAFLFFTKRYGREFGYEWTFHVAPLIPVSKADGSTEELVFDPVFVSPPAWETDPKKKALYDSKPISIEQWVKYFVYPDVTCPLITNIKEYLDNEDVHYCYIIKSPMYLYSPIDFERDARGESGSFGSDWYDPAQNIRTNFRLGDLLNMKKAINL